MTINTMQSQPLLIEDFNTQELFISIQKWIMKTVLIHFFQVIAVDSQGKHNWGQRAPPAHNNPLLCGSSCYDPHPLLFDIFGFWACGLDVAPLTTPATSGHCCLRSQWLEAGVMLRDNESCKDKHHGRRKDLSLWKRKKWKWVYWSFVWLL